ncbi:hypothetical protein [Clostridium niameyense]|nr:hypothetical protein [Clostridium niameyense]
MAIAHMDIFDKIPLDFIKSKRDVFNGYSYLNDFSIENITKF